jgi:uncharacterized flavoprotein (TIGR03862 family)
MAKVAVIGAGPAGLIAAEVLARGGAEVVVFERMAAPARKFLLAGRGGLNLTHSEDFASFLGRYRPQAPWLLGAVRDFPPDALIAWCEGLGIETFVGSSGRVFPRRMKASPVLRAWLARLATMGVALRARHRLVGIEGTTCRFATPEGEVAFEAEAVLLALGGASWPRLGSDGGWVGLLPEVPVTPFAPSNCGFQIGWSPMLQRHAGAPLKRIALRYGPLEVRGEAVLTARGLEGGAVYALSAALRQAIEGAGAAHFCMDLRPDMTVEAIRARLATRGRAETVSAQLRKAVGLSPAAIGLVQEVLHAGVAGGDLAQLVKALPLTTRATTGLERAISSAGGIAWPALDERFMLRARPGVFAAGEMLDWEAPTGGYLLQGCFATGVAAARGALAWLRR